MELHERLLAARQAAGYETATDAARSLGVKYPTYAGHENGSSGFRAKTAAVYARKFGVSFEWLLRGTGNMHKKEDTPELAEAIALMRTDPDFRDMVSALLKIRKGASEQKHVTESQDQPPSNRK